MKCSRRYVTGVAIVLAIFSTVQSLALADHVVTTENALRRDVKTNYTILDNAVDTRLSDTMAKIYELEAQIAQQEALIDALETHIEELQEQVKEPIKMYIPPETYEYEDLVYAARLVAAEARGCSKETQLGVAQVIWDRMHCESYNFGKTIREVIDKPGQFTNVYRGRIDNLYCMEAVIKVFYGGYRQFEENVYYFYNPHTAKASSKRWFEKLPLIADHGDTVFRGMN